MNDRTNNKNREDQLSDVDRKLGFDEFLVALRSWEGRAVRIELGSKTEIGDVIGLVGHGVASVTEVLAGEGPHLGRTIRVALGNELGEPGAGLAFDERSFESARDHDGKELVVYAGGLRLIIQANVADIAAEAAWSPEQRSQALRLLVNVPWGDIENALFDMEEALRLAIGASEDDFGRWSRKGHVGGSCAELGLTSDQVRSLSTEERLAYIAALVRSAAGALGAPSPLGITEAGSPAELLENLLLTDCDLTA